MAVMKPILRKLTRPVVIVLGPRLEIGVSGTACLTVPNRREATGFSIAGLHLKKMMPSRRETFLKQILKKNTKKAENVEVQNAARSKLLHCKSVRGGFPMTS